MNALALLASSDDSGGGGAAIIQLGILLLIPAAMYFLMIRPQRRRQREQREMQSALGIGDEVITTSGIYGFITGEDGDKFWLEIDDDVQIRIARAAVQMKVDTSAPAAVAGTAGKGGAADAAPTTDASSDDDE